MDSMGRSGILAVGPVGTFWLVKAATLIEAHQHGREIVSQIEKEQMFPVHPLELGEASFHRLNLLEPRLGEDRLQSLFDTFADDYCVFGVVRSRHVYAADGSGRSFATLVTRHEDQTDELDSPGDCYCKGPRQHSFLLRDCVRPCNACGRETICR
jgi:hypothetical protein